MSQHQLQEIGQLGTCFAYELISHFVSESPFLGLPFELYCWVHVWAQGYYLVLTGGCLFTCCVQPPSWSCLRIMVPHTMFTVLITIN